MQLFVIKVAAGSRWHTHFSGPYHRIPHIQLVASYNNCVYFSKVLIWQRKLVGLAYTVSGSDGNKKKKKMSFRGHDEVCVSRGELC